MRKQIVPATAIIFNDKSEVLLAQRHYENDPANRYHGAWGFPGGGIEENEQPSEAAIRETLEETGINISILSDRPIVMSVIEETGNHLIKLGYISKYVDGKIDTEKDSGTSDAQWFALEEIEKLNTTLLTNEMAKKAHLVLTKDSGDKN